MSKFIISKVVKYKVYNSLHGCKTIKHNPVIRLSSIISFYISDKYIVFGLRDHGHEMLWGFDNNKDLESEYKRLISLCGDLEQ